MVSTKMMEDLTAFRAEWLPAAGIQVFELDWILCVDAIDIFVVPCSLKSYLTILIALFINKAAIMLSTSLFSHVLLYSVQLVAMNT